jgi:hypothetical protein
MDENSVIHNRVTDALARTMLMRARWYCWYSSAPMLSRLILPAPPWMMRRGFTFTAAVGAIEFPSLKFEIDKMDSYTLLFDILTVLGAFKK